MQGTQAPRWLLFGKPVTGCSVCKPLLAIACFAKRFASTHGFHQGIPCCTKEFLQFAWGHSEAC
jgi:hypothetical protein